jgi:hypothetical protein
MRGEALVLGLLASYSGKMADSSRRRSVAKAAIDNIMHRLAALPPSTEVDALRAQAEEYRLETDAWTSSRPAAQEKERLMKRLLKLHTDVAKLERDT